MSDNLMEKMNAFGERLKISGAVVGRKMSAGMSSMSFKMKELLQGPTEADRIVEEATLESLDVPNWVLNLHICETINRGRIDSVEFIHSIKKRIVFGTPRVQYLSMVLLEMCVNNCERPFYDAASEGVLGEMVKLIDDPNTVASNRNMALMLIQEWGRSRGELHYLYVYQETYQRLKSRGIRFPNRDAERSAPNLNSRPGFASGWVNDHVQQHKYVAHVDDGQTYTADEQTKEKLEVARNSADLLKTVISSPPKIDALKDDLTTTLVEQCRRCQYDVRRIIEAAAGGDDEALLCGAFNVNDEIQKVLSEYEELQKFAAAEDDDRTPKHQHPLLRKPAKSHHQEGQDEVMNDLDEMIFGKKNGGR